MDRSLLEQAGASEEHIRNAIDQGAIRNEWRGNKHAGVEELIDAAADAAVQIGIFKGLPRRQASCREIGGGPEQCAGRTVENTERQA